MKVQTHAQEYFKTGDERQKTKDALRQVQVQVRVQVQVQVPGVAAVAHYGRHDQAKWRQNSKTVSWRSRWHSHSHCHSRSHCHSLTHSLTDSQMAIVSLFVVVAAVVIVVNPKFKSYVVVCVVAVCVHIFYDGEKVWVWITVK